MIMLFHIVQLKIKNSLNISFSFDPSEYLFNTNHTSIVTIVLTIVSDRVGLEHSDSTKLILKTLLILVLPRSRKNIVYIYITEHITQIKRETERKRQRERETVQIDARRVGSTWLLQRMSYSKSPRRSVWILGLCGDTIIIMHAQMKLLFYLFLYNCILIMN